MAMLWGVGPKTQARLAELGLRTVGDLARWPAPDLEQRFGAWGADLARHARGIDDRPVETERETKSISKEITFARDVSDRPALRRNLLEMCDQVAGSLRRQAGRFVGDEAAGTMMIFALTLPVLIAAGGAAMDYSLAASARSKMQAIADAAALAAPSVEARVVNSDAADCSASGTAIASFSC